MTASTGFVSGSFLSIQSTPQKKIIVPRLSSWKTVSASTHPHAKIVRVDNTARINEIRELLRSGASSVQTDGTTVSFNLDSLRKELRELEATDDTRKGRRPVASSINLGGF